MTNEEIIFDVACQQIGEEKATFFLEQDGEVPFHTYEGWKRRGKYVRRGEKGIETRLWQKKKQKEKDSKEDENDESKNEKGFVLVKAYVFSIDQVETMKNRSKEE